MRDKVTRQCPQTTTFEEKGEPKRIRTEVLSLTSLINALPLGQMGARFLPQSYQYPNLSAEGADRVGGQLRGDNRGTLHCGRVWRKVPESYARSVILSIRQTFGRGR